MRIDKSFTMMMGLFILAAGVSIAMYFRPVDEKDTVRASSLPMEIGGWKGEDIALDDRTYSVLETKNVLMRKYTNAQNEAVYLYIVVSEINRKVAHPPEICYTGSGADIIEKDEKEIDAGAEKLKVNRFISRQGGTDSLVYYWFKAGDKFTASYLAQQTDAMLAQFSGKKAVIAMIRVSTDIINSDKVKSEQLLQEFTRALIPALALDK